MTLLIALSYFFSLLAVYFLKWLISSKTRNYPPGPPGLPLVGNIFNWPTSKEWEIFNKWKQIYGDIVHANVLGTHMIVLNSYETATELFHAKGGMYSDRPSLFFVSEMMGWKDATPLLNDGADLREHRRLITQQIGSRTVLEQFRLSLQAKIKRFLCQVLDEPSPEKLFGRIYTLSGAMIFDVTYGYEVEDGEDGIVRLAESVVADFIEAARPGAHLVDIIPSLARLPSWLPGTGFQREAAQKRVRIERFLEQPFQLAKDRVAKGLTRPSFVANNLEEKLSAETERILKWVVGSMYGAGTETTSSVIYSFFLLMTVFPNIQAEAQAEIDRVVGDARLPSHEDRPLLPFVDALVKEVYRYGLVLPQGVAHMSVNNDIYRGFFIPKGSVVIPNICAMSEDPRTYNQPEVFDPTRFLGESPELDPASYVFGFGRRICPGRVFADNNIFFLCATTLATMDILKATGPNGEVITPQVDYIGELTAHAREFQCRIVARSANAAMLLREQTNN